MTMNSSQPAIDQLSIDDHEGLLRMRVARGVIAFAPFVPVSTLVACMAIGFGLWSVTPVQTLKFWLVIGLLLVGVQLLMWRALAAEQNEPSAQRVGRTVQRWFVFGSLATGLFWGAVGMALFPENSVAHQILLASVLVVVCALWLPVFALRRVAIATVAAPALLPMVLTVLTSPSAPSVAMGSLLLLVLGALLAIALVSKRVLDADRPMQQVLYHHATHDALVGLVNHAEFHRRLQVMESAFGSFFAVVIIDLDCFKDVNDTAGHEAGDRVLREVGCIVREEMRRTDIGARIGGDEFAVLMSQCTEQEAERVAAAILRRIAGLRLETGSTVLRVTASIGIASGVGAMHGARYVLSAADQACYAAKMSGRNRIEIASDDGRVPADRRTPSQSVRHRSAPDRPAAAGRRDLAAIA